MFNKCPHCGSYNVRRSSVRVVARSARPILRSRYRCRECRNGFWATSDAAYYFAAAGVVITAALVSLIAISDRDFSGAAREVNASSDAALAVTRKLAEGGDGAAEYQLAQRHAVGDGVPRSEKEAATWLSRAARHGNTEAQYEFGIALREGRGVIQDYERAFEWLQRAAEAGNARAQLALGRMYYIGSGVQADKVKAYTWLNLAAAGGANGATSLRDTVRRQLDPEDIVNAQAEARRFSEVLSEKATTSP